MSIRHLKIFILVANYGNMSLAAKELFISQPSVSQAIKELEDFYGVKLFERLSKKLYITDSGELLLKYARYITSSFDEMEINLKNTGEGIALKVGATVTVGTCILNPIIKEYERLNNNTSTKVVVNNTNFIEQLLLQSKLDVAIVEGDISHEDLIKIPIYRDKLVAVVGKEHAFYNRNNIDIKEFATQYLITREEGSGGRDLFDQVLQENDIKMKIKWTCTTTEAIKSATIAGEGIAVLSTLIIEEEIKNKSLHIIPIDHTEIYRDICVVYHKDKFISEKMNLFLKCAQNYNKI